MRVLTMENKKTFANRTPRKHLIVDKDVDQKAVIMKRLRNHLAASPLVRSQSRKTLLNEPETNLNVNKKLVKSIV